MSSYRAPKGTYDVLPPESHRWRRVQRVFEDLAETFGYGLTLTPLFEQTELFARGVGEDTEVVEKQMYTFKDRGGRSVTLRPEATASVVRAAIQAGGVATTIKGSYWGPMFRYERPQKGRTRQFYQGGIEYFGTESAVADVEVIEFGFRLLEQIGVADIDVRLNSIGDPTDRSEFQTQLRSFLRPREDQLSDDAKRRIEANPMRVLDSKADRDVVADAPVPLDHLGDAASAHFAEVRTGLERLGIPYTVDNKLVRGLDYYNRTVFEYVPKGYGAAQNSVGGGGRYDGLFALLGGKSTPGVGLAMGIDRILLAMEGTAGASAGIAARSALDVFVVVADERLRGEAAVFLSDLRREGVRADWTVDTRSVKAQFKAADNRGASVVLVIGDEWANGEVTAKELGTGEQSVRDVKEIAAWLQAR
jgi:histidyl-tRNA synthetase